MNKNSKLSKLQKAMLVWILEDSNYMSSRGYERPFAVWRRRPQWYGKPLNLFGSSTRTWYGETPAISRSLKRLVTRGLVSISYPSHKNRFIYLTEIGRKIAEGLVAQGVTNRFHKQHRDGKRNLFEAIRKAEEKNA